MPCTKGRLARFLKWKINRPSSVTAPVTRLTIRPHRDRPMDDIAIRIDEAINSDDACHNLRYLARDLVSEGHSKHLLNDAFLNALASYPANLRTQYEFQQELGETLQLLALWTSEHHLSWPEPWYSGQGFEDHKTPEEIANAETWLQHAISSRMDGVEDDG